MQEPVPTIDDLMALLPKKLKKKKKTKTVGKPNPSPKKNEAVEKKRKNCQEEPALDGQIVSTPKKLKKKKRKGQQQTAIKENQSQEPGL